MIIITFLVVNGSSRLLFCFFFRGEITVEQVISNIINLTFSYSPLMVICWANYKKNYLLLMVMDGQLLPGP